VAKDTVAVPVAARVLEVTRVAADWAVAVSVVAVAVAADTVVVDMVGWEA